MLSRLTIILSAVIICAGCNAKTVPTQNNAGNSVTVTQTLYPTGKPGAAVSLNYQAPKIWTAGSTDNVKLTFSSSQNSGQMNVIVSDSHGLQITGSTTFNFDLASPEIKTADIVVTPPQDGYYQLDVRITIKSNDNSERIRIYSIPINVGNIPKRAKSSPVNGEVVMPAIETYE
jgi:hypothetical protein